MVMVGDKVKAIACENMHGLQIGEVVNVLYVDEQIKVDDPNSEIHWWLWDDEFELLNQEQ